MVLSSPVSHWSDGQRGRDSGNQRRSPLDVIMNQIRRKRTASDRKPLGRLLSWTSDRTGIPEDGEAEERGPGSGCCDLTQSSETSDDPHVMRMSKLRGSKVKLLFVFQVSLRRRRASGTSAGVECLSSCRGSARKPTAAASAWLTATSLLQTCWS